MKFYQILNLMMTHNERQVKQNKLKQGKNMKKSLLAKTSAAVEYNEQQLEEYLIQGIKESIKELIFVPCRKQIIGFFTFDCNLYH